MQISDEIEGLREMTVEFINDDFLLTNQTAKRLYHEHAEKMPLYDFHCHLPAEKIAADHQYENITQMWIAPDHYKWRAMRAGGIQEEFITGDAGDYQKFEKWAQTVPFTVRNPLYHWTHLELKNYFGVKKLLSPDTAEEIYHTCNGMISTPDFSVRNILRKMNVKLLCTTNDPLDSLQHHKKIQQDGFEVGIYPTFRTDKTFAVDNPADANAWLDQLENVTTAAIDTYPSYIEALRKRHDYFHQNGCRLSDTSLITPYAEDYTDSQVKDIFLKLRAGNNLDASESLKFKSAVIKEMAVADYDAGWVMQLHIGALRDSNTRLLCSIGPDAGCDSIADLPIAIPLAKFLDTLDAGSKLPKTIVYNLNPKDSETILTALGSFQDASIPGKMQYGAAWWFLDQKDGIEKQINALSNIGLLSRFIGMLTDSRSFLSFPRHEYFRRILCNIIGCDLEAGLIPHAPDLLGKIVEDICFNNAKNYFPMKLD
jgi:glucuronate isomerase